MAISLDSAAGAAAVASWRRLVVEQANALDAWSRALRALGSDAPPEVAVQDALAALERQSNDAAAAAWQLGADAAEAALALIGIRVLDRAAVFGGMPPSRRERA